MGRKEEFAERTLFLNNITSKPTNLHAFIVNCRLRMYKTSLLLLLGFGTFYEKCLLLGSALGWELTIGYILFTIKNRDYKNRATYNHCNLMVYI